MMLISVTAAFDAYLETARDFFTSDKCPEDHRLPEDDIRIIFGAEELQPGVYFADINTANFALRDVIDQKRSRYEDMGWTSRTTYGIADSPEQAIAFANKDAMPCPCLLTMYPVDRSTPHDEFNWDKHGPEIGSGQTGIAFVWHLHPLDPVKLEAVFGILA